MRELTRHITFYLKHRQERENKVTDGTFTKDDDYLVIKLDPAYCWRFTDSRGCRRMSRAESQVLWASRQKSTPVISGSTTTVSTPLPSSTAVVIPTPSLETPPLKRLIAYSPEIPEPHTETLSGIARGNASSLEIFTVYHRKPSLPDITLPHSTESDENIMDQILPDSSRADNNYALEELIQVVLAGNELQKQMLEIQGKMLTELRRTTDKLEVAIGDRELPAHLF